MKKTKIALTLVCAILLVAASVMGTLAYLTSTTGEVKNTFTVGNVTISLDEAKVNAYGEKLLADGTSVATGAAGETLADRVTSNNYKLIPGHSYTKDPTVHVTAGSEKCYLFVKVVNGISTIEATGTTTIANQMSTNSWTAVNDVDNVYYYNQVVDAGTAAKDVPVFGSFTLDNADVSSSGAATITIQAAAVQADGFDTATAAFTAAGGATALFPVTT